MDLTQLHSLEDMRNAINATLVKVFEADDNNHYDSKVVIEEIFKYVFLEEMNINLSNRYECFYMELGKAVATAEGWLKHSSSKVEHYEETQNSIDSYIKRRYGIDLEKIA